MNRMLVTGGAGFIGTNFVRQALTEHGYDITVLDALTYAGNRANLSDIASEIEFRQGDVADRALVDRMVAEADIVVHFAAESHVDNSLDDPWPFVHSNLIGTYSVLEAVRRHDRRLHHVSTDEVFGDLQRKADNRFTERTAYDPSSPYAATKAGADLLVSAWVRSYGVAATVSNCGNNYGPFQHVEKFVPRQITNVLCGDPPKVFGTGANIREWTHVEDHNEAVHQILKNGRIGETYLVGSGDTHSNREIVELTLQLMGQPAEAYELVPDRPGHDLRYAIDTTKIKTELGWEPRYRDIRAGLATTIDWYREHPSWWRPHKGRTEARYRLIGR